MVNEINLMRQVQSERFVGLEAVYETANSVYIIMELLQGGPIWSKHSPKLEERHAKFLIYQILKGVRDMRKLGIIHRDLKPDNIIMLHKDLDLSHNQVKIVDLGLGTFFKASTSLIHRVCGTPGFMAPEVIRMKPQALPESCSNSDIFSVGVIFYSLITGKMPYKGKRCKDVLRENYSGRIDFNLPELSSVSAHCL